MCIGSSPLPPPAPPSPHSHWFTLYSMGLTCKHQALCHGRQRSYETWSGLWWAARWNSFYWCPWPARACPFPPLGTFCTLWTLGGRDSAEDSLETSVTWCLTPISSVSRSWELEPTDSLTSWSSSISPSGFVPQIKEKSRRHRVRCSGPPGLCHWPSAHTLSSSSLWLRLSRVASIKASQSLPC